MSGCCCCCVYWCCYLGHETDSVVEWTWTLHGGRPCDARLVPRDLRPVTPVSLSVHCPARLTSVSALQIDAAATRSPDGQYPSTFVVVGQTAAARLAYPSLIRSCKELIDEQVYSTAFTCSAQWTSDNVNAGLVLPILILTSSTEPGDLSISVFR